MIQHGWASNTLSWATQTTQAQKDRRVSTEWLYFHAARDGHIQRLRQNGCSYRCRSVDYCLRGVGLQSGCWKGVGQTVVTGVQQYKCIWSRRAWLQCMRASSEFPWNRRKKRDLLLKKISSFLKERVGLYRKQLIGRTYWAKPGQRQQQGGTEPFRLGTSTRNAQFKKRLRQSHNVYSLVYLKLVSELSTFLAPGSGCKVLSTTPITLAISGLLGN